MHYTHFCTAACILCLAVAAPAQAQKLPAKTAVKKAAAQTAKRSAQAASGAAVARQWRTEALKDARQIDKMFNQVFFKSGQAHLAQLVDVASFRIYSEDHGIAAAFTNLWDSFIVGLHTAYLGPTSSTSPLTIRKELLQNEVRLKHAVKNWQELKPVILKTASVQDYTLLSQAGAPTRFFFEDSPHLDVYSKQIAALTNGRADAISIMANGQTEIETLYRKMLAFAHGKGAFPIKTNEVYHLLALKEYSNEELADLQKELNSLECDLLRSWGWSNRDIRRVIALYRSQDWIQPYNEKDFFPTLMDQHQALSSWRKFWKQAAKTDLKTGRQIQQQLNAKTR